MRREVLLARSVFFTLPLRGHINPALPLVRELVARGDQVTCVATSPFADDVSTAGAAFRAYGDSWLADLRALPGQTDQLSWLLMATTRRVLDAELRALRADPPDYLITDSVAPWGQWIGLILNRPVVTSVSTFAFNRHVMAYGVAHGVRPPSAGGLVRKLHHILRARSLGRSLRRTYGVRGPGVFATVMGRSALNIVYTSTLFQPSADTFDDGYLFVDPSMGVRADAAFDWDRVGASAVVYASLGTVFNADTTFYRACLDACAALPVQLIMPTGSSVSAMSLEPIPANAMVVAHAPQLDVLKRASAFVTHGGMNSVNESLSAGVPMVVVPQMSEQAIVGRRVEELGAGIYLAKEDVTPETLGEAIGRVLTDPRFRAAAEAVRESFAGAGGVSRAADAIRALVQPAAR